MMPGPVYRFHGMIEVSENSFERRVETVVAPESGGVRMDAYLSRRYTYLSRNAWQAEIKRGRIFLNESCMTNPHRTVRAGDRIRFSGMRVEEPPVDDRVGILFEDQWLAVLDKSGNMPVHPAGRYFNNTLVRIMERKMGCALLPVHRLDRETSGVILFAKDSRTASAIQRNFSRVRKSYVAIVHGTMTPRRIEVDVPIGYDPSSEIKKMRLAYKDAPEAAFTDFKALFSFGDYTLVRAYPRTGRLHQIRVHLRYAGFPIVGDKMYGKDPALYLRFIGEGMNESLARELEMARSALHSRSLSFYHPREKKMIYVKAPLPQDFREFILSRSQGECRNR
ncbi:MAG: RluA family pseudouridine synthase [Spirochaetes bacterium]|nr:MAG: RluA family pseudouridine synthase [Spirochaetota bacterium]